MERYKVVVAAAANNDMEKIYDYIYHDLNAPIAAINQYNRIADAVLSLDLFPERIKVIDSEYGKRVKLRQMLVDNYSIFFVIENKTVTVLRVLYSASDIRARLENLF